MLAKDILHSIKNIKFKDVKNITENRSSTDSM